MKDNAKEQARKAKLNAKRDAEYSNFMLRVSKAAAEILDQYGFVIVDSVKIVERVQELKAGVKLTVKIRHFGGGFRISL